MANVKKVWFESDGSIPNHPTFPVLIYPEAFTELNEIEDAFNRHGWTGSWIGGVFDFHHYHSNSHEVLGVVSGEARVMLGGEQGQTFQVKAGDVVLLPAGTGHKKLEASNDFQVCGAYPEGQSPNLKKGDPAEHDASLLEIRSLKRPESDPVYGENGPVLEEWK
ncbi:cupin domain-containing protein [Lentibacillus sediminis]|uniref:cupin domain-containing protein n=1 Tax=Lentibacillus sediminis TaxID=1940529 RepID=UPI000C1BF630|nr:cupin domain-containing protein [Lentibacillus sediminis]